MSNDAPIPLLHEGDSYQIYVSPFSDKMVLLSRILRYESNQNVEGVDIKFTDLDPTTRFAVIRQINRRFVGKTIKI